MLKLTQLTDEPAVCQNNPLGVMILSYAALCREDEGYCRFYEQNDAAVLMQNGSTAVVCANENADFDEIKQLAGSAGSSRGTGGMITKLHAAQLCMDAGIDMMIANGSNPAVLYDIFDGQSVGTRFVGKDK